MVLYISDHVGIDDFGIQQLVSQNQTEELALKDKHKEVYLTLCILMDSPNWFDTINLWWYIVYI